MVVCYNCGKETGEIVLLGNSDCLFECQACGSTVIGKPRAVKCKKCGQRHTLKKIRRLSETERIPTGLCDSCKNIFDEMRKVVEEGGIYWKCKNCGSHGTLEAETGLAKLIREKTNIKAPDPVGIDIDSDNCPVCSKKKTN